MTKICKRCIDAHWSHGEKFFTKPMEWEDCTDVEYETEIVICDFCEEENELSDMFIIKED